jgi:hypothetical protein
MEIRSCAFDARDVEQMCIGAGIIPISVCPKTNVPHLLLGRERWVPMWKGSCRWSGFEGSRKQCESTIMTAAREFVEETMGCVRLASSSNVYERIRNVICQLGEKKYWKQIVLKVETERRMDRFHTTFLIPMEWNVNIPETFLNLRLEVEQVDRLLQEWHYTRPACIGEKHEVIGPIVFHEEGVHVLKSLETSPCILRKPWKRECNTITAVFRDAKDVNNINAWNDLRERITRAANRCNHPCVRCIYDDQWRLIQDIVINYDYLEKDQVKWWSINELDVVIAGQGQNGSDRFRPYFLPVLQTTLRLIREHLLFHGPCELCEESPAVPEELDECKHETGPLSGCVHRVDVDECT